MKAYSIISLIAALAIAGGCSSTYRSAQTPDAVYYSPPQERTGSSAADEQVAVAQQGDNPDAGKYITYEDGDNSGYADDYDNYYTQRFNMFDRPGSLYSFNSYYGLGGGLGGYYSPYLGYYGSPYMALGNPFMFSYPFLSLGLNYGSPWGGWYSPMYGYGAYSPYYAGYMNGYRHGYYGGGYGYYGGGYGKYINSTPRPAVSYGPRRSVSSRAATGNVRNTGTSRTDATTPRRVFRSTGNTNPGGETVTSRPRRVFKSNPSEHPINVNTNTRVVEKQPKVRIFRRNDNDRSNNTNDRRVETYRPTQQTQRQVVQPRTYERNTNSSPSFNSSSESHSAPARTFSPRGRR